MIPSMEENKPPTDIQLPPGFRFHPSDEELIIHYLKNKATSNPLPASIIADIDLYKYNPWELPKKALFGEEEWYFFSPRDRKYPNGARPNRVAASGFWKATGTDKPIFTSCGTKSIGVKKALVFYKGRPPKGYKTDWILHEYRLLDSVVCTPKRKGSMRLDDWVLCRVRLKTSNSRNTKEDGNRNGSSYEASSFLSKVNEPWPTNTNPNIEMVKSYLYNDCPMLPYILTSQNFPNCMDTDRSSISFQDSDKSCTAVIYDEGNSNQKENLQFSVSNSSDSLFNPLKRKLTEGTQNQRDNRIPPSKKINEANIHQKEENMFSVIINDGTVEMNIYETDQSDEGNNFSEDHQWSTIMQYHQELNNLAFTESD